MAVTADIYVDIDRFLYTNIRENSSFYKEVTSACLSYFTETRIKRFDNQILANRDQQARIFFQEYH